MCLNSSSSSPDGKSAQAQSVAKAVVPQDLSGLRRRPSRRPPADERGADAGADPLAASATGTAASGVPHEDAFDAKADNSDTCTFTSGSTSGDEKPAQSVVKAIFPSELSILRRRPSRRPLASKRCPPPTNEGRDDANAVPPAATAAAAVPREDAFSNSNEDGKELAPKVAHSAGVAFYPPSDRYWRIGGKWYDFSEFRHPGGAAALELARDRFEDCTFVFEAHHHNYPRAREVIRRYEVPAAAVHQAGLRRRPEGKIHPSGTAGERPPTLLPDSAFYSVLRRRAAVHLRQVGAPGGGPTWQCVVMFWTAFAAWAGCYAWLLVSGAALAAVCLGFTAAWLGAFGHNWVHQPRYKSWAYLSLDTVGFSSDGWFREHNLQHHMYTNTPWDNHFEGTAPFLVTDPTKERNVLQRCIMPYVNPVILSFGLYGNYTAHLVEVLKGNEVVSPWKVLLPLEIAAMAYVWGGRGLLLMYLSHAILGIYYFTIALMNHNAEACVDVRQRNAARDWGEAQLCASADWSVGLPFVRAGAYLWLNYHTVHHLFPRVDFSHHPALQQILIDTCKEFGIEYSVKLSAAEIYVQMVRTFSTPKSLMQEIMVYGGEI